MVGAYTFGQTRSRRDRERSYDGISLRPYLQNLRPADAAAVRFEKGFVLGPVARWKHKTSLIPLSALIPFSIHPPLRGED